MVAKYPDDAILKQKIDSYFVMCDIGTIIKDVAFGKERIIYKPYTITGLCVYLDITRETLNEYSKQVEHSDTIKRARLKIEQWVEEHSLTGDVNPAAAIFNLKNNFGWVDKSEIQQTGNITLTKGVDLNQLSTDELKQMLALAEKASINGTII